MKINLVKINLYMQNFLSRSSKHKACERRKLWSHKPKTQKQQVMRNNGTFVKHIWYLIAGQLVKHIWYIAGQLGRGKFPRGSRPHVIQPRQYATHLSYYTYVYMPEYQRWRTALILILWYIYLSVTPSVWWTMYMVMGCAGQNCLLAV